MCLKSDLGVKTIHFTETHFHFVMSLCKCQAFSKKWIKSLRRKKTNSRNTHLFHKCIKKSIKMSHQTCKWGKSTLSHIPFITWQHAAWITSVSCRGVSDMVVFGFFFCHGWFWIMASCGQHVNITEGKGGWKRETGLQSWSRVLAVWLFQAVYKHSLFKRLLIATLIFHLLYL